MDENSGENFFIASNKSFKIHNLSAQFDLHGIKEQKKEMVEESSESDQEEQDEDKPIQEKLDTEFTDLS